MGRGVLAWAVSSARAHLLIRLVAHLLEVPDDRDHTVIHVADRLEHGGRQVCRAAHQRAAGYIVAAWRIGLTKVVLVAARAAVLGLGPDLLVVVRVDDLDPLHDDAV